MAKKFPLFHPFSRRLHIVLLCMIGFFCTTFMRIHFALTMTCMVNSTALAVENEIKLAGNSNVSEISIIEEINLGSNGQCGLMDEDGQKKVVVDYGGELVWNSYEQNLIFSGTFWGSLITVLPSMFFIERFSPRHVLQISVALYILVTVITPFLATHFGYFSVFLARIGMGLGEGFVFPTNNAIIGNWFPSSEKSTALSIFTLGNQIASAAGSPMVAAVCASDLGWPATFYFAGIFATGWSILWFFTASSHPAKVKMMTKKEKEYLLANVVKKVHKSEKTRSIPYSKILTSPAFLGQLQCHFFVNLFMTLFQIYLPSYFKEVLHLGVIANGTFTAIPNIFNMIFKVVWGIGIDKLKENKILSNTKAVKVSHGVASFGSSFSLILLAFFVDCSNPTTGLIFFCLMYSSMGTFVSGFYTSLLSLAPQYTATMSAISMFVAMIGRLTTPAVMSMFRKDGTAAEWQNIFIGCSLAHIFSGSIFLLFGSGELQDWAKVEDDQEMNEKEKLKTIENGIVVVEEVDVKNEMSATLVKEDSLCL
ncbi:putative transporter slc-17.3 [Caenorhabditis elegans]|uniref:Uncharacterized transporter slc-17.3 n=1 Tax=Caenorhabditis elegans TaxID=6239 RepID=SL173_CAEEL|nr:putative transporter slc-17.3 [Caenorhabditis elegans]P34272.2 RecName: Full=Uncharacterized transporter slc-17.3 [Caenorhabditis elegans]CCD62531.1 Uncharacterized transporter slc-17.3 [Caenorhabditis elegans]|eukprot:NP_498709.2 Uncharacterized transporter slc-17.3 [Caenorhabditis elegans]